MTTDLETPRDTIVASDDSSGSFADRANSPGSTANDSASAESNAIHPRWIDGVGRAVANIGIQVDIAARKSDRVLADEPPQRRAVVARPAVLEAATMLPRLSTLGFVHRARSQHS
jgi:hypothetical protein